MTCLQAYGLTETTAAVFANSPDNNVIGSVGKAMKGVEAKIVYATNDPQPQEDGGPATGEIALRGAVVMKGYWNRPDATAAVLRDGWFYTGRSRLLRRRPQFVPHRPQERIDCPQQREEYLSRGG